jgi:Phage protein Gp138 N-terminal domain
MLDQQAPSLGAVIAAAIDARLVNVHTHLPARIESYDAVRQRCSVQVELRQAKFEEDGARTPLKIPLLTDVPVLFGGGGDFRTTYPLRRGDQVWLEICEASLALWKPRGGDVDPADDRRMKLSDAVAVTGLRDGTRALKNCPTDRMSMGHDTGATVEITQTEVRVGGNTGTDAIVVQAALTGAQGFMAALSAAITAQSGNPPGAAALGALQTALTALNAGLGWKAGTTVAKAK